LKDIADKFLLAPSTAHGCVDRLVRKDYVGRYHSEQDRRKVILEIKESGKKIMKERTQEIFSETKKVFDMFSLEDQSELLELLERFIQLLKKNISEKRNKKTSNNPEVK